MTKKRMTKKERSCLDRLQAEHGNDPESEGWAVFVNSNHFEAHRGASEIDDDFPDDENECVIFGNDGFKKDVRARREVAQVAMRLEELRIPVLGFGVESGGYSWAMRVDYDDNELLDLLVWDVWFDVCGGDANPVKEDLETYLDMLGLSLAA